jgi:hypothetical protein
MKKFTLALLGFFLSFEMQAQFQCDLGGSFVSSSTNTQQFMQPYTIWGTSMKDTAFYSYDVHASGFGIYVYPKYHFAQAADLTFSLGAPCMLGMGGSSSSQLGSTLSYIYDFNLCLDINGGRLNRRQDYPDKPLGFFAGVGFGILNTSGFQYEGGKDPGVNANTSGITYVPEGGYFDEYMTAKSSGLIIHAGVVGPLLKKDSKRSIGLRCMVKPGLGAKQMSYFGFSAFVSLSNDRGY